MDRARWVCVLLLAGALGATSVVAQSSGGATVGGEKTAESGDTGGPRLRFGFEGRLNFRQSDDHRFPVKFPFKPVDLPVGQSQAFEQTVNAGSHFEVSKLILYADADWGPSLTAHGRLDFLDLYDRNPTSSGKKADVKELWVRFGRETDPGVLPERSGAYLRVGKFAKFERQNDRHLESYGIVSTAFNRFNDAGTELGLNLGRHVYVKVAATSGNPVFLRDPNALAGDNGTPDFLRANPNPNLKSGIVILYDSEVEDFSISKQPELGGGLGVRFADAGGRNSLDVLAWGYKRKLADATEREGTFYKGDLQLLRGPFNLTPLPIAGDEKRQVGGNVWLYLGGFSFFGQYVDQRLAGLPRKGLEGEVAWSFDLPLVWALDGRQLFPTIAPAFRYSKLDNQFKNNPLTPAPSFAWDWEKLDFGLRLGIVAGTDLTLEYAINNFILGSGATAHNNEFLTTLRFKV